MVVKCSCLFTPLPVAIDHHRTRHKRHIKTLDFNKSYQRNNTATAYPVSDTGQNRPKPSKSKRPKTTPSTNLRRTCFHSLPLIPLPTTTPDQNLGLALATQRGLQPPPRPEAATESLTLPRHRGTSSTKWGGRDGNRRYRIGTSTARTSPPVPGRRRRCSRSRSRPRLPPFRRR